MGTSTSPTGHTLAVNSQYLTLDGKPWLPVMGEYHFARSPEKTWDDELRKMKAAGVDIVSSYVLWNYHEAEPGKFDWSGDRNLRQFVQSAANAGMKVFLRIVPWVHAEARFGGLPDWVVNTMPTHGNDPAYLRASARFYQQIGAQLKGLLWKDGGPVIGVQFENELDHTADGAAHIAALKKLGLEAGLDLPIYSVFGTARYKYPPGEVTPTFGGYPDRPWGTEEGEIAPKESYAFLFDSRIAGDIGQQVGVLGAAAKTQSREAIEKSRVPYLGAEYGGGLPQMYRRRTLLGPLDVPALHAVQLGSGANMMGYYMFHGGRNPRPAFGGVSLEESTLSGGFNDTPQISNPAIASMGTMMALTCKARRTLPSKSKRAMGKYINKIDAALRQSHLTGLNSRSKSSEAAQNTKTLASASACVTASTACSVTKPLKCLGRSNASANMMPCWTRKNATSISRLVNHCSKVQSKIVAKNPRNRLSICPWR